MFCEIKKNETKVANDWFRRCEKERMPYVVVTHRKKYSAVDWDYISLPKAADAKLDAASPALLDQLQEVFQRHASRKSKVNFSAKVGGFDNLLPDEARAAAREVFQVLQATQAS
ncbi:MAG: hypothetical protein SF051_06035 [Elusimicrobiota bacterium]|nr:hypothetical protein [Elusimicrobiota bacterium]